MHPNNHIAFAGLFFVSVFTRGVLLSVVPLQALQLLGAAQAVSVLYFAVSVGGISAVLSMPILVRVLGVYRTMLVGVVAMCISALLLQSLTAWVFVAGLFCHVFAIAALELVLSLYTMQCISRRDLMRFEPTRVLFYVLALSIGPVLGVYLESHVAHWAPFAATATAAVALVCYARALGLHSLTATSSSPESGSPLRALPRFFRQPRLRLSWTLSLVRASWWVTFIIYTPIYAKQAGLGELIGASVVSIGSAWTLTVPFWGYLSRRHGIRPIYTAGFCSCSVVTMLAYAFTGDPWLACACLVVAALGATLLDGSGNVMFFRAVHAWERPEMSSVFLTYRDIAQLLPPGLFAVLLHFYAVPVVFIASATWMLAGAALCRFIPRRM